MDYIIRKLKLSEKAILEDFLYEAIFQPEGTNSLSRDIIYTPEIYVFIDNYGLKDDYCLVTELKGKIVGAVWSRILAGEIKGYGNIDEYTPELAISLMKEYRGLGLGTEMMKQMIQLLREEGYAQASLSVDKNNYAVKMYKNVGFEVLQEREHDYLMCLQLN